MIKSLKELKEEFKNRLFFYPADTLYLIEIAKNFGLKESEYYKLYSLMGAQELENTLALYSKDDFTKIPYRINLRQEFPFIPNAPTLFFNDEKPTQTIGILSSSKKDFSDLLKVLIQNPLAYQNIRIIFGTQLKTKMSDYTFNTLLYGFNPFNSAWIEYLRKNRYNPKDFTSHTNMLFAHSFGVFSLAADKYDESLIRTLVNQGLRLIEVYLNGTEYATESRQLIENFGLLKTGGIQ